MRFVFSSKLDCTVVPVRRPDLHVADINFTDYKFLWCGALTTYIYTYTVMYSSLLEPLEEVLLAHVTVLPGQECPSHLRKKEQRYL